MDTPSPRKRGFASGYPELDALYRHVYDMLMSNPWRHPFQYGFVPDELTEDVPAEMEQAPADTPGTHRLTIGQQYRFERHTSSPFIQTLVVRSGVWVASDDGAPVSFACSTLAARDRGRTLDQISPVFWPVALSTPQDALHQFTRVRKGVWDASCLELEQSHPHLFTKRTLSPTLAEPHGRVRGSHASRALMVMARQQDRTQVKFSQANYHRAIGHWWNHFVDKSLLSSLVSVVGASQSVVIDFAAYAAFTRTPNLSSILEGLPALGDSRRVLLHEPWTNWTAAGLQACLGSQWPLELRQRVDRLPRPLRLALAPDMVGLSHLEGFSVEAWLSQVERVGALRLLPRQQAMVTRVLVDLAYAAHVRSSQDDEDPFSSYSLNGPYSQEDRRRSQKDYFKSILDRVDLVDRLFDLAKVWKMAFPDRYFRFGSADRSAFLNDARALLGQSPVGRLGLDLSKSALSDSRGWLSPERLPPLQSALLKYNIEKTLPRRGRGRPRKDAPAMLSSSSPSRPRPAM